MIKCECLKTLLGFTWWCLNCPLDVRSRSSASSLLNSRKEKTCCWGCLEEWEGDNIFLTFGLWAIAGMLHQSESLRNNLDDFVVKFEYNGAFLVEIFKEIIYSDTYAPGPRWYASYILSCLEFFVIPTELCKRIRVALCDKEYSDLQLTLVNGESVSVHSVVLAVRCPVLLPPKTTDDKAAEHSSVTNSLEKQHERSKKEVRLSAHVDHEALEKLLEFVYLGYLEIGKHLVPKLKILAKHCRLQLLLQLLLNRKIPKWGTPVPSCDLTLALGPVGNKFS